MGRILFASDSARPCASGEIRAGLFKVTSAITNETREQDCRRTIVTWLGAPLHLEVFPQPLNPVLRAGKNPAPVTRRLDTSATNP